MMKHVERFAGGVSNDGSALSVLHGVGQSGWSAHSVSSKLAAPSVSLLALPSRVARLAAAARLSARNLAGALGFCEEDTTVICFCQHEILASYHAALGDKK